MAGFGSMSPLTAGMDMMRMAMGAGQAGAAAGGRMMGPKPIAPAMMDALRGNPSGGLLKAIMERSKQPGAPLNLASPVLAPAGAALDPETPGGPAQPFAGLGMLGGLY